VLESQPKTRAQHHRGDKEPRDRLVSTKETKNILGVSVATVRRLIKDKKLIAVHLSARRLGVRVSSINQLMGYDEAKAA
jgi:predicted site-specific integrase-resolvase